MEASCTPLIVEDDKVDGIESMECKWEKYPSINDVDLAQVEKIRNDLGASSAEFVALVKVHGSNFAFETDGQSIAYFSRNRRIAAEEHFVGKTPADTAMRQYHTAVREVFRLCTSALRNVHNVVV